MLNSVYHHQANAAPYCLLRPAQTLAAIPRQSFAWKSVSIRTRLLLLTMLAIMLPVLLQTARYFQDRQDAIDDDTELLAGIAQRRVVDLHDRIQGTEQLLFGLSQAPALQSGDRAMCSAFLSDVLARYPQYTGILTITPDGQLFCDSLQTGRDLDLTDRAYFQGALEARDGVVLQPAFGRLTGIAVLQIAHPARSSDGELLFVLLASLDLRQVAQFSAVGVPEASVLLLDHAGTVLTTSREDQSAEELGAVIANPDLLRFAAEVAAETPEVRAPDGTNRIWAAAHGSALEQAQVYVLASAPRSAVVAAANNRFINDLALMGLAAIGGFLLVFLLSELAIRRQIARITSMAEQMAAGDLSARIAPPLPSGELGTLMHALNAAAQSLEQRRADIDELNDRLRQSQRMESLGQLTGGVAHDFNNLLTVVMGNAELLAEGEADPERRVLAEMMGDAAKRGAELTQSLLAFARKQALNPRPVDVNQMVATMDRMLRRTLGEQVEIELIRADGLWPATVDQAQLENALLNLCLNARDAMGAGGRLTLETANVHLDDEYAARNAEVAAGAYVMLAVSDTGAGIQPEDLERVFEPFFTTKEKGKGTGLGLAMVYGFVKQSGGHITVYSEPGQGTTVKLYLPRAADGSATSDEREHNTELTGGTETILLVEDDQDVRRYAHAQLQLLGYTVIETSNGASALAAIRERTDIDLLFTDVVMPGGMNGRDLADAVREIRPELPILFTSGYAENAIVHHGRLDKDAQLLNKPYRRNDLAQAIRTALRQ